MKSFKKKGFITITAVLTAVITVFTGCERIKNRQETDDAGSGRTEMKEIQKGSPFKNSHTGEPYAVKTILAEDSAVDPKTGKGVYVRYTVLTPSEDAPDTFKNALDGYNRRAREAAEKRLSQVPGELTAQAAEKKPKEGYLFETYSYIVTVTRADDTAFSILETEYERGLPDTWSNGEVSYRFGGKTYETKSGEEVLLSDLTDEAACGKMLEEALNAQYGISGPAGIGASDYAWTADALGIRFYFNSDSVSSEKRHETGDYYDRALTVGFPYTSLTGAKASALSDVPDAYIARMDRGTVYDLPHGKLSAEIAETEDGTVIRMIPDKGQASSLTIEYADAASVFYIIRSSGGFYLFRERSGYQEGFFYDFERPDGGYGRFAYNNSQYFDSFLREIDLALPYDPYCVHMCEVRRSFGEKSYDGSSFIPHGHYSFPDDPEGRYKRFALIDDSLQTDMGNTACRLLEDRTVTEIDQEGNELGDITVKAGTSLFFEAAYGEADRYQTPPKRGRNETAFAYDCRLNDGRRIRLKSKTESVIAVGGEYLGRFTEPVSLAEAGISVTPKEPEAFTVRIGKKDYPVIPDYSKTGHVGEEIDFGGDIWWQAEGYAGRYEMTDEDRTDMEDGWFTEGALQSAGDVILEISDDGQISFDYFGKKYDGQMPDKRYYGKDVSVGVKSEYESRSFEIILRDGRIHEAPNRIEFYSEGLPATNEPSKVPPLSVYLTKVK